MPPKPKVFVTRRVHSEALDLMKLSPLHYSVDVWDSDEPVTRDELIKRVKGVHAIYCTIDDIILHY